MGPSGSGKTTLLSLAGGLLRPSSGRITLADIVITDLNEKKLPLVRLKHVGFIFQSFNLLSALTVLENVRLVLDLAGVSKKQARERAMALLKKEGLAGKINRFPREISGGEAQRVSIARALVNDPDIILADEPTANLDAKNGHKIMMLLKELAREKNKAVVIVSHDQRVVDVADRVLWLEDGKLQDKPKSKESMARDPVCQLLADPADTEFTINYQGREFFFCSKECYDKFNEEPKKYAGEQRRVN